MKKIIELAKLMGRSCYVLVWEEGPIWISVPIDDLTTQGNRILVRAFGSEQITAHAVHPDFDTAYKDQGLGSFRHFGFWDDEFLTYRLPSLCNLKFHLRAAGASINKRKMLRSNRLTNIKASLIQKGFRNKRSKECVFWMVEHLLNVASPFDFGVDLSYPGLNVHYLSQTNIAFKPAYPSSWSNYRTRLSLEILEDLDLIEVVKRQKGGNGINLGTRVILSPELFALPHEKPDLDEIEELFFRRIPEQYLDFLWEKSKTDLAEYIEIDELRKGGLAEYRLLANEAFFSDAELKCDLRPELMKDRAKHLQLQNSGSSSAREKDLSEFYVQTINARLKKPAKHRTAKSSFITRVT